MTDSAPLRYESTNEMLRPVQLEPRTKGADDRSEQRPHAFRQLLKQMEYIMTQLRSLRAATLLARAVAIASSIMVVGSCGLFGVQNCDAIGIPGIRVTVVDSRTRAGIAAGATLTVTEDAFREVHTLPADPGNNNLAFTAVISRPGVYSLTVEKTGFKTWSETNVRVAQSGCHVKTADVVAELEPN